MVAPPGRMSSEMTGWYGRRGKRIIDLAVALLSLPFTAPLIATCWVVARWSSRESGFFRQERVGQHGRGFSIVKLQTMRSPDPHETEPRFGVAAADASRITRTGAWLRRTKLDELPQVWNILCGDMTFVGPRPDV